VKMLYHVPQGECGNCGRTMFGNAVNIPRSGRILAYIEVECFNEACSAYGKKFKVKPIEIELEEIQPS
jgi:hypothetical protein